MSESIRSIEIVVKVDTTKRTFMHTIEADSLDEAADMFRDEIADIRWSL